MIALRIVREPSAGGVTFGALYLNDAWVCWTLEDAVRQIHAEPVATWKVPAQTAIPAGRYPVKLTESARFRRVLPELLDVPGFTGIRIHAGNTELDTEGCILVGQRRDPIGRAVRESRAALDDLVDRLQRQMAPYCFIDIENPPRRHLSV